MSTTQPNCAVVLKGQHIGPIHHAAYSADGEYVVTGGADRSIRLWNAGTGQCIKTYSTGHGKEILCLALPKLAQDSHLFASGSADRSILVWDVVSGSTLRRFPAAHGSRVNALTYSPDAQLLFSASYDATVRIWDLRAANSRSAIQTLAQAKDSVESIAIQGVEVLAGSVDGKVRRYDFRTGRCVVDDIGHPVLSCSFSGDGNCVLVGSLDSQVRLFDKEDGELLNSYSGHVHSKYKIGSCFSNTDADVVSGSEDGHIFIWDLVDANVISKWRAHDKVVTSVAYHPKKAMLLSASVDGLAKIWTL